MIGKIKIQTMDAASWLGFAMQNSNATHWGITCFSYGHEERKKAFEPCM